MAYFYFLLSKVALLYFYGLECNGADIKLIKFDAYIIYMYMNIKIST